jgi:RNA polymerase sigma factor (sigma-70 family)
MDRINDGSLDERIKADWTELYPGIFAKASRYVPRVSQNRKEDGENALHTTIERTLEGMWLQRYRREIRRLFFKERHSLTQIRQHLAQNYGFRVSEKRLRHFLRPLPPGKPPQPVRKDFSDRTPDERVTYVRSGIRHKSLQWLRPYRRWVAEILPEKDADATAHDPAKEVEEKDACTKALHSLPKREQEIMELAEMGYTTQEIADKLGISSNSVRQRKHQALQKMKGILQQDTMP